jgi:hypothetical protein
MLNALPNALPKKTLPQGARQEQRLGHRLPQQTALQDMPKQQP